MCDFLYLVFYIDMFVITAVVVVKTADRMCTINIQILVSYYLFSNNG